MNIACLVDEGDIPVTQGNNFPPLAWQFLSSENPDVLLPLDGQAFYLTVFWGLNKIEAALGSGLTVDLPTSIVTWNITLDQSRQLPVGRVARYELERWFSNFQQSVVRGYLAVDEGRNPDTGVIPVQPETTALLAAMTVQPNAARQTLINQMIFDLKNAGIWAGLDLLYVLAAHDAQAGRVNWKNPAQIASVNGVPTFTVDRGYTGDGVAAYLGTGVNLSALSQFTQNACAIGIYIQNNVQATASQSVIGTTTTPRITIGPRSISDTMLTALMSGTSTTPMTDSRGHAALNRTVSTGYDRYKNGVKLGTVTAASLTTVAEEIILLRSSAGYSGGHLLSLAHVGASMTQAQVASLNTIISAYMTGVGA